MAGADWKSKVPVLDAASAYAERVQQATLYTYQKGGATLLEVLAAQRTLDELQLSYYEALAEHARSLVAVELAAGRWDVPL